MKPNVVCNCCGAYNVNDKKCLGINKIYTMNLPLPILKIIVNYRKCIKCNTYLHTEFCECCKYQCNCTNQLKCQHFWLI